MPEFKKTLDIPTLENWLWEAACKIRGADDAPKFKDYILPLIFLKRLSDVFDDEIAHLADEFGGLEKTQKIVDGQHQLVRFYIPKEARWDEIKTKTTGLGEHLTSAVRKVGRINPRLHGAIDVVDFNVTYADQRIIDDHRLANLVQVLSRYRLGIDDVEPDILGRAYEYLLRKFAEGQGQSAGEFYTPREVAILMARILEPEPGMEVYDPCCGSGGLLIKCHLRLLETHGKKENGRLKLPDDVAPLKVYGQELIAATFTIARMNTVIHDMEAEIAPGDTMRNPTFKEDDGSLKQFDIVTANPMWNDDNYDKGFYESDGYGRFQYGIPSKSSADWGWLQHMLASLSDTGRMAVVQTAALYHCTRIAPLLHQFIGFWWLSDTTNAIKAKIPIGEQRRTYALSVLKHVACRYIRLAQYLVYGYPSPCQGGGRGFVRRVATAESNKPVSRF